MKKVLMVSCEGLGNGGVQTVMMGIVKTLSNEFIFDILLFTNEERFHEREFLKYGGKIHRIAPSTDAISNKLNYYIGDFLRYKKVRDLLKNERYDIIHCNKELESGTILHAAYKSGIPIRICHSHIINTPLKGCFNIIDKLRRRLIEKYATTKIACSKESAEKIFENDINVFIIKNFYDDKKFFFTNTTSKPQDKLSLCQLGSYSANKNQIFSIDVVKELKKEYPDITLYLIGYSSSGYDQILLKYIHEQKLDNNVYLIDGNQDFIQFMQKSSYFLFPSHSEGFGTSLIEAQAMGLLCYASDTVPTGTNCGGVTYLSLSSGATVWANKINLDYKCNLGIHKKFDTSKYTIDSFVTKIHSIYNDL